MSVVTWTGNALDQKQINTITVANTWAAGDTATMTINGKDVIVTVGTGFESTANVAIALKEAWMAATRLDGTATTISTSNAGGQEFGEFSEVTATVSGSVVTLIANKAGRPFTLTVTESTAGTGTATGATTQSATGKEYWSNGDNWDGGSAPVNDDIVVFRDSNVSCRYGLPNGSLEVTLQVWMSYTGEIGLPRINVDNPALPYYEYRQRYVRLDDAGGGTDIAHRFGLGKDGIGPGLINLKHSTLKCSPVVYNTGPPLVSRVGTKALNICCTANTSTLNIMGGSVDWSSQDGGTSAFATVTQSGGDSRGVNAVKSTGDINCNGGTMLTGNTTDPTIYARGGTLRVEGQTGTVNFLFTYPTATVEYSSSAVIDQINSSGGTLDFRGDSGAVTVQDATFNAPTKIIDPSRRIAFGNPAQFLYDVGPDLQLGASADSPLLITFA